MFETTCGVLCRDRFSILAALCKTADAPLKPDSELLLEEMYNEANFYRLGLLRQSIEDRVPDPRQRLCDERYGLTHQVAAPSGRIEASNPLLPDPYGFSRTRGGMQGW